MARYLITDHFEMDTLELVTGEKMQISTFRPMIGDRHLKETLSRMETSKDRIAIQILDDHLKERIKHLRSVFAPSIHGVPNSFRVDLVPGDFVFVIGRPEADQVGPLNVFEIKLEFRPEMQSQVA